MTPSVEIILGTATVLGGISAIWFFWDKLKAPRKTLAKLEELSPPAISIRREPSAGPQVAQESPPRIPAVPEFSPNIPAEELSLRHSNGLELEEVLQTLSDKQLTELQKHQFVRRNKDTETVWRGKVVSVSPMWKHDDSEIIVMMSPLQQEGFGRLAAAVFAPNEEASLSPLSEGDVITVSGRLHFSDFTGDWSPSLRLARLLRFEKKK